MPRRPASSSPERPDDRFQPCMKLCNPPSMLRSEFYQCNCFGTVPQHILTSDLQAAVASHLDSKLLLRQQQCQTPSFPATVPDIDSVANACHSSSLIQSGFYPRILVQLAKFGSMFRAPPYASCSMWKVIPRCPFFDNPFDAILSSVHIWAPVTRTLILTSM